MSKDKSCIINGYVIGLKMIYLNYNTFFSRPNTKNTGPKFFVGKNTLGVWEKWVLENKIMVRGFSLKQPTQLTFTRSELTIEH